jgi:hypothetical protein
VTIVAKKHDLIGLHIYDEREMTIPNIGLVKVSDAETGKSCGSIREKDRCVKNMRRISGRTCAQ